MEIVVEVEQVEKVEEEVGKEESHHFGMCTHLTFLYIIGHNILWRPHDPHGPPIPKSGVVSPQSLRINVYAHRYVLQIQSKLFPKLFREIFLCMVVFELPIK